MPSDTSLRGRLVALINWCSSNPWMFWLIWLVNVGNAIGAFIYYWPQLRETPEYLWPWVPDSPMAAVYFTIAFTFIFLRRPKGFWSVLAIIGLVKYGLWSGVVFTLYWSASGYVLPEHIYIVLTHLAMPVEAIFLLPTLRPMWRETLLAVAWYIFHDYLDYTLGIHSGLPNPEQLAEVRTAAITLTLLPSVALVAYTWFVQRGTARPAGGMR